MRAPIGFFDSGIGGLSVWQKVVGLLPHENTVYVADSAHVPYGTKSHEELLRLSEWNTRFLLQQGCKMVVVACNTATSHAIAHLRATFPDTPFVGIEPAVKPAAENTGTQVIGVLATKGTLTSDIFQVKTQRFAEENQVQVIEQIGRGLVELVEGGQADSAEAEQLLSDLLHPILRAGADYLVLGCTHYPFLIPTIQKIAGNQLTILDATLPVAKRVEQVLREQAALNTSQEPGQHRFVINTQPQVMAQLLHTMGFPQAHIEVITPAHP
jgi:glutamate racemase